MLNSYKELREIDVTPYCEDRDGVKYLNWAKCNDLLHQNGAEEVYFESVKNPIDHSDLFYTELEFIDKNKIKNKCYYVEIEVHIDGKVWKERQPLMNGPNPVKDNSMNQLRIRSAQTRAFVKSVAIHTGLGFDLWLKNEEEESKKQNDNFDEDLSKHSIQAIKKRTQEEYTNKMLKKMSTKDIAEGLGMTEDEVKAYFTYYDILDRFETKLKAL